MKTKQFLVTQILLIALASLHVSIAWTAEKRSSSAVKAELIYGPEWTFTNREIAHGHVDTVRSYFKELYKEFRKKQVLGIFSEILLDSHRIVLKTHEGIKLSIGNDPGVIEVQSSPLTLLQWKKNQKFFQKNIFDVFAKVGLQPHEREGAGHVNIGLEYFIKKKNDLAERFVIDYLNHPGVGVVLNSLTANLEDAKSIDQYVAKYYSELLTSRGYEKALHNGKEFNISKSIRYENFLADFILDKFVAVGLRSFNGKLNDESRFEMRQLRPQKDMNDYIKVLEIFEARIKFLETKTERPQLTSLQPVMDGWVYLGQFADYLAEAGLDWKDYKSLMPKVWQNLPEKNFIHQKNISPRFLKCSTLF